MLKNKHYTTKKIKTVASHNGKEGWLIVKARCTGGLCIHIDALYTGRGNVNVPYSVTHELSGRTFITGAKRKDCAKFIEHFKNHGFESMSFVATKNPVFQVKERLAEYFGN